MDWDRQLAAADQRQIELSGVQWKLVREQIGLLGRNLALAEQRLEDLEALRGGLTHELPAVRDHLRELDRQMHGYLDEHQRGLEVQAAASERLQGKVVDLRSLVDQEAATRTENAGQLRSHFDSHLEATRSSHGRLEAVLHDRLEKEAVARQTLLGCVDAQLKGMVGQVFGHDARLEKVEASLRELCERHGNLALEFLAHGRALQAGGLWSPRDALRRQRCEWLDLEAERVRKAEDADRQLREAHSAELRNLVDEHSLGKLRCSHCFVDLDGKDDEVVASRMRIVDEPFRCRQLGELRARSDSQIFVDCFCSKCGRQILKGQNQVDGSGVLALDDAWWQKACHLAADPGARDDLKTKLREGNWQQAWAKLDGASYAAAAECIPSATSLRGGSLRG